MVVCGVTMCLIGGMGEDRESLASVFMLHFFPVCFQSTKRLKIAFKNIFFTGCDLGGPWHHIFLLL
jgi:hypothetical protein